MPISASALDGYDISNWQCGIDTANVPGDFVVVGSTWGSGGVYNTCLSNGVNTDANRMLTSARDSGKRIGIYHYARGGDPIREADFFVDNNLGWIHKAMLVLDWESGDNVAWGNINWPRQWAKRVYDRTGVRPVIYVSDSAYWQVAGMEKSHDSGIWIAQYANMNATGYQHDPWNNGMRGEVMRQYTSSGRLNGYNGNLDLDVFNGDVNTWDKYVNPNNQVSETTISEPDNNFGKCVVVNSGDTISAIANRTGLYPIEDWNVPSNNINLIYPGQSVCYRSNNISVSKGHVVVAGESLWSIFGSDWPNAAVRNGISNPNLINIGQVLY